MCCFVFSVSLSDLIPVLSLCPCQLTVVANQFIIREVDPTSDKFLYSANLWEVRSGFCLSVCLSAGA